MALRLPTSPSRETPPSVEAAGAPVSDLKYRVERRTHGFLLCEPFAGAGVSLDALHECAGLFPENALIDIAIARHYAISGEVAAVHAVTTEFGAAKWRTEIALNVARRYAEPEARWWYGTDVGQAAASIFTALAAPLWRILPGFSGVKADIPRDSAEFARCVRLLKHMTGWHARLDDVAHAHAGTKWTALVPQWERIASLPPAGQTDALSQL